MGCSCGVGFRVLGFWGFGVLGFWGFGVLGFWGFGVLGFWGFGVLGFWGFGFRGHRCKPSNSCLAPMAGKRQGPAAFVVGSGLGFRV